MVVLNVIMLKVPDNTCVLSAIIMSVVMLSVVAPALIVLCLDVLNFFCSCGGQLCGVTDATASLQGVTVFNNSFFDFNLVSIS